MGGGWRSGGMYLLITHIKLCLECRCEYFVFAVFESAGLGIRLSSNSWFLLISLVTLATSLIPLSLCSLFRK